MSEQIQQSVGASAQVEPEAEKPEWLSVKEAVRRFSISRSSLYELISEGRIKSAPVRKRGNVRGKRLISFDSLSEYVESFVEPVAF